MVKGLFNVSVKTSDARQVISPCRVLQVLPIHYPNRCVSGYFYDCNLLVVTPDKSFLIVSINNCRFLD